MHVYINHITCGVTNPAAICSINPEGYYLYGGLENGEYTITVYPNCTDGVYLINIPQAVIQSYDFTGTIN